MIDFFFDDNYIISGKSGIVKFSCNKITNFPYTDPFLKKMK